MQSVDLAPSVRWICLEELWQHHRYSGPTVTVLLPTHNRPDSCFFGRALKSVLDQTFSDFELLVLLNGISSTDRRAYEQYRHLDSRMRFIELEKPGLAAAINEGIRQAKGKFLWMMEDDDWNDPRFLQTMVRALTPEDVGMAYCLQAEEGAQKWHAPSRFDPQALEQFNYIQHPMRLARTALVRRVGGVSEELQGATDYDLNLRLAPFGAIQVDQVLSTHTWHNSNLCLTDNGLISDQQWIRKRISNGFYRKIAEAARFALPVEALPRSIPARQSCSATGERAEPLVTYVVPPPGPGGGMRVILNHLNGLIARGLPAQLYALRNAPTWFKLEAPVCTFPTERELIAALQEVRGVKVATWWETARLVLEGCRGDDVPYYLVQDIESSYYPGQAEAIRALGSYSSRFRYLAGGPWVAQKLRDLFGLESEILSPGVDERFFQSSETSRSVLAFERHQPMKNYSTVQEALQRMVCRDASVRLHLVPASITLTDKAIARLYATSGAILQPSTHEGYCLPILEAMASGCPVVTTWCNGNVFCRDGENCLIVPAHDAELMAHALLRLLDDSSLRDRLAARGRETALEHRWKSRLDRLADLFQQVLSAIRS